MKKKLYYITIIISIVYILGVGEQLYAQEDAFLDESFTTGNTDNDVSKDTTQTDEFLDDSFVSETDNTIATDQDDADALTANELEQEDVAPYVAPLQKSFSLITFSVKDSLQLKAHRKDTAQNKNNYVYHSPWKNELLFNNYLEFRNKKRFITLRGDYNLYAQLASTEDTDVQWDTQSWSTVGNVARYELKEANIAFNMLQSKLTFKVGKIYREYGSGYLVNPSNPLQRSYGKNLIFSKNYTPDNFSTPNDVNSFTHEDGSTENIGFWASEVEIAYHPITFRLAYLPYITSGFEEFDRPQHSFLSNMQLSVWDSVIPMVLAYNYGEKWFFGGDLSIGIGDSITLHGEGGLSFENELLILKEKTASSFVFPNRQSETYNNYELVQYDSAGIYPRILAGTTYTLSTQSQALFSILFEIYYNGKGLNNEEWSTQISYLEDIYAQYDTSKNSSYVSSLSDTYKGMGSIYQSLYSPLEVRPLYAILRLYRDDVFMRIWKEQLNLSIALVYSIFDTSFHMETRSEVILKEMITLGIDTTFTFGLAHGAFTELTDVMNVSVYSKIQF